MISNSLILKGERYLNILEISCVALLLFITFAFQIILNELPCPLCLLQRVGFLLATLGLLMNLRFGFHPSHYALTILSALFSAFVALRQVALHVVPNTGAYGNAFLGLHLYTWSFIVALVMVAGTTIMLAFDRQYQTSDKAICSPIVLHTLFAIIALLTVSNIIDMWMICGASACPDNPIHYIWH